MSKSVVWLPIVYQVDTLPAGRGRGIVRNVVQEEIGFEVEDLGPGKPAIEVATAKGLSVDWRQAGGSLWRTLVAADGSRLGTASALEAEMRRAKEYPPFVDYPFRAASIAAFGNRDPVSPFSYPTRASLDAMGMKVETDGREAAIAVAQIKASDIAIVDGVLRLRSEPPVWRVGSVYRPEWECQYVALHVADHPSHAGTPPAATFAIDAVGDAVAFARRVVERVQPKQEVSIEDVMVTLAPGYELPPVTIPRVEETWLGVKEALGGYQVDRMPDGLLLKLSRARVAVADYADAPSDEGLDRVVETVRALAADEAMADASPRMMALPDLVTILEMAVEYSRETTLDDVEALGMGIR